MRREHSLKLENGALVYHKIYEVVGSFSIINLFKKYFMTNFIITKITKLKIN